MGLDMYLEKRTYVKTWDYMKDSERVTVTVTKNGKPYPGIHPERITYIIEEAGYWCKANAIHRWFVEHVQGRVDDCGYHYVSSGQLQELLTLINAVLSRVEVIAGEVHTGTIYSHGQETKMFQPGQVVGNPSVAQELLPTQSGFFFGNTDYDEYYLKDVKHTKAILEEALRDDDAEYYYHSSW